ncbi:MAG: hypothetical protein ACFB8W_04810 [Elainellaceae cyanobacterium]
MNAVLKKFRVWLGARTPAEVGQTIGLEQERSEPVHADLPEAIATQLQQAIRHLPPHPVHLKAVGEALDGAVARWQTNRDEPNCLVILGNPVDDLAALLQAALTARTSDVLQVIQLQKTWDARPHQYLTIHTQLKKQVDDLPERAPKDSLTLATIPRLDWCFLRCIDGLSGVEYLKDVVLNHRSQFWLIGCNRWAWTYLEHVYRISAYLDQPFTLPRLTSLQIRDWLTPVTSLVAIAPDLDEPPDGVKSLMTDDAPTDLNHWSSRAEQRYFDSLANKSLGVGAVAAHLWLRSLCPAAGLSEDNSSADQSSADQSSENELSATGGDRAAEITLLNGGQSLHPSRPLQRDKPALPPLPALSADDRYLLFSLLMHGGMSLPHLRLSLGDDYGKVRAQVQILQRAGVVKQLHSLLSLNPLFYPGLKADLSNNNFVVGEDD